jgi:mannobiose 2-epimerase
MEPTHLRNYAQRVEAELTQNILPFWIKHVVDHERGGFYGSLSNDLLIDRSASRGALLSARILWTFSAAHRQHPNLTYLEMAHRAYVDLEENFRDREFGGYFWSISAEGEPLKTRKQVYGQAFAIYALSEYHRASGLRQPLDKAIELHRLLEKHALEPKFGGYLEAFSREWNPIDDVRLSDIDLNEPKSQNTHLHVMEAYTNLLRVWPDPGLKRSQAALIDVMLTRILCPKTHHLQLFFANDWAPRSRAVSYGHGIEASWLLIQAASVLGDAALFMRLKPIAFKIAEVTLAEGIDADGAVFNAGDNTGVTDTAKEWWPQAEAVVGFLDAYQLFHDERFLAAALRCWDFIETRLVDRAHGEWLRGVDRAGNVLPDQLKVSFWKCPYHNGRACMEAASRLRTIAAANAPLPIS